MLEGHLTPPHAIQLNHQTSPGMRSTYQDGNVRESLRIKGVADGTHAAVHHVGWGHHISAGASLAHHLMKKAREEAAGGRGQEWMVTAGQLGCDVVCSTLKVCVALERKATTAGGITPEAATAARLGK